jgi:hypothetical protein
MNNTTKHIFFNTVDEAERFVKLYGGVVCINSAGDFHHRYYGEIAKRPMVLLRTNNMVMDEICSSIGLKKKRINGNRKCYIFE